MIFKIILIISLALFANGQSLIKLPSLSNVEPQNITVSGFSSGGTMASQLHVSHSSTFTGVGMLSCVYYRCGQGRGAFYYSNQCQKGNVPVSTCISDAKNYANQGKIDPLSNLMNQKVYVWVGTEDEFVKPEVRARAVDFYKHFVIESNIHVKFQNASHEFPTDRFGPQCPKSENFIGNCNYLGSYETLKFLLGENRISYPNFAAKIEPLQTFDQTEFTSGQDAKSVGIDATGLLYIPSGCKDSANKCLLHFHLHGCAFGRSDKIEEFLRMTGFIETAEQNNIVTVFPRATSVPWKNPNGCWDMWGFNSADYANKNGVQIQFFKNMADRILGKF